LTSSQVFQVRPIPLAIDEDLYADKIKVIINHGLPTPLKSA